MTIANIYNKFKSCEGFTTDTRKIEKEQMFFCLKGENFNGNKFAADALKKGAKYVVIDEDEYHIDKRMILVDDVLKCMQNLANHHRKQFNIPVLGITGTNGKTTTKELVKAVLSRKYKTHATVGNFNNHIGVPMTLLSMPNDTEFAIIEMGANHIGEIAELCEIAEPDFGIITSIGKAHLEGFGNLQGVITTKNELYKSIIKADGNLFVNADNELLMDLSAKADRKTYGQSNEAVTEGKLLVREAFVGVSWNGNEIISQLVGSYNFDNMMAAICVGESFGVEKKAIAAALREYTPQNQRSQLLITEKNKIVVDAYNANPTSMAAALDSFRLAEADSKLLILGDMLELGKESQFEHLSIVARLKELKFNEGILVGPEFFGVAKDSGLRCFEKNTEALEYLKTNPLEGKLVLLKGSRGIALEILLDAL
ncbi:MAG: UDP-N-acetylmuramoyl-tripeptide--D-alanyl-D-alanine ligase [Bacteroidales bacterium]|nr:UDP-N-acetylmuramoyl-tripeptide--D-alanyl-D-alanine ligase [Bacteroidales bacterium]